MDSAAVGPPGGLALGHPLLPSKTTRPCNWAHKLNNQKWARLSRRILSIKIVGGQIPATPSMNLATALAAERHYRAAQVTDGGGGGTAPETPLRMSLMGLLEEEATDGGDGERETVEEKEDREGGGGGVAGSDWVCCVCMGRKKGAAFVPCGHTFCRVCSRELWLNRGSCPLCNTPILQILDIF